MNQLTILLFICLSIAACQDPETQEQSKKASTEVVSSTPFYIGTYTKNGSEGIYKASLKADGSFGNKQLVARTENPSFLAKSTDDKYLLAVNENEQGTLSSFKIEPDSLTFIGASASGGAHPCFVAINNEGFVLTANYTGGNVGLLQMDGNGNLSAPLHIQQHQGKGPTARQGAPHAHSARFAPDDSTIIAVDLGIDKLLFSTINRQTQKLVPLKEGQIQMKAGAGPRHIAFHPNKNWIYVINELNGTVSHLQGEAGKYTIVSSISTLPTDFQEPNTCADIHISKDGTFLYASNRGHNSIAIYSIGTNGSLQLVGHESTRGDGPRNFALSPDNDFLLVANQLTNTIISFERDSKTGKLSFIDELEVPVPVCVLF